MQTLSRRVSSVFITSPLLLIAGFVTTAALYYGNRDLSVILLIILSIGGAARIWTIFGHRGIEFAAHADKNRVFPGHELDIGLTLTNTTSLPLWCQVIVPLNGLAHGNDEEIPGELTGQTSLLWHDTARFEWTLSALRRGVYRPGPVSLTSGDLFGFFPREKNIGIPIEIIVYPRLVPLRSFSLIRRDFFGTPGEESPVRDPVYILGTHDYQHGRPARFIHWKASARRSILQEKVFEPTEQEKVFFVVLVEGFAESGEHAAFEEMLEIIASMATIFDEKGIAAGFATDAAMTGKGTFYRSVRRDPGHLACILEMLSRMRMEKSREVPAAFRNFAKMPSGVTSLCFSYRADAASRSVAEYFRRRRIPVIHYACTDPQDRKAGIPGSSLRMLADLLVSKDGRLTS